MEVTKRIVSSHSCPVSSISHVIGKKWTIPIIREISQNIECSFNFIHVKFSKISPKILSARLSELETYGIIDKNALSFGRSIRIKYNLTDKGEKLNLLVNDLIDWQDKYNDYPLPCEKTRCSECPLI